MKGVVASVAYANGRRLGRNGGGGRRVKPFSAGGGADPLYDDLTRPRALSLVQTQALLHGAMASPVAEPLLNL